MTLEVLKEIYNFLFPYLKTAFSFWLGHKFFIKQYVKEKIADRNNSIHQQKDSLNKEAFDQIQQKTTEIQENLGWVRSYHKLLPDSYFNPELFKTYIKMFDDRCSLLVDRLFILSTLLEKYDFVIDTNNSLSRESMRLHADLGHVQFNIINISKDNKCLNELCEKLLAISSKINLHIKKVSDESKKILKSVYESLNERIEKNKTLSKTTRVNFLKIYLKRWFSWIASRITSNSI